MWGQLLLGASKRGSEEPVPSPIFTGDLRCRATLLHPNPNPQRHEGPKPRRGTGEAAAFNNGDSSTSSWQAQAMAPVLAPPIRAHFGERAGSRADHLCALWAAACMYAFMCEVHVRLHVYVWAGAHAHCIDLTGACMHMCLMCMCRSYITYTMRNTHTYNKPACRSLKPMCNKWYTR